MIVAGKSCFVVFLGVTFLRKLSQLLELYALYAPQPGRVLGKLNARQSEHFIEFLQNPFF